jgi:hypothetical protein
LLSSCCCWRSATSWRLAPFSHRSASRIFIRQPGCIPSPMVTQNGDHQFDGGEKQVGLWPLPRPQLQGSSSSLLGRGARRAGAYLRVGWRPASSSGIWGWKPSSSSAEEASSSHAGGRRTAAAWPGCSIPSSVRATVAGRTRGSHNTSYATRAVLVFWDGPVLIFSGENGGEDPPVRFGAADARWCGVGGQVDVAVGAEVVAAGESFSVDETVSATRGSTSGSLALISGSRPPRGDANESLPAVAYALGPSLLLQRSPASHPELVVPQALRCGGCSYPREWNRSSICNGTLSAGVCSLWLSGPEHLGILGAISCFFLISSTRTRLSAS